MEAFERLDEDLRDREAGKPLVVRRHDVPRRFEVLVAPIASSYAAMYSFQRRRSLTSLTENFQRLSGSRRRIRKRRRCSAFETFRKILRMTVPCRVR